MSGFGDVPHKDKQQLLLEQSVAAFKRGFALTIDDVDKTVGTKARADRAREKAASRRIKPTEHWASEDRLGYRDALVSGLRAQFDRRVQELGVVGAELEPFVLGRVQYAAKNWTPYTAMSESERAEVVELARPRMLEYIERLPRPRDEWQEIDEMVFRSVVETHFRENFVEVVAAALAGPSATEPVSPAVARSKAGHHFDDMVTQYFENEDLGAKGDASGTELQRQTVTRDFHDHVKSFIESFGPIAAQEGGTAKATFLWSGPAKFAAFDSEIRAVSMASELESAANPERQALENASEWQAQGQAIGATPLGQLFESIDLITNKEAVVAWSKNINVWRAVSIDFAANATGEVHVYLSNGISTRSVFWNEELPELRANENVPRVICHYLTKAAQNGIKAIGKQPKPSDAEALAAWEHRVKEEVLKEKSSWVHKQVDATPLVLPDTTDSQKSAFAKHDARDETLTAEKRLERLRSQALEEWRVADVDSWPEEQRSGLDALKATAERTKKVEVAISSWVLVTHDIRKKLAS